MASQAFLSLAPGELAGPPRSAPVVGRAEGAAPHPVATWARAGAAGTAAGVAPVVAAAVALRRRRRHRPHARGCPPASTSTLRALRANATLEETVSKQAEAAASIQNLVGVVKGLVDRKNERDGQASEDLRAEIVALRKHVAILQGAYEEAADELEMTQVEMQVDMERRALASKPSEAAKRTAELEANITELEVGNARLLQQRGMVQGEVKRLTNKVVEVNGEKDELGKQNLDLASTVGALEDQLADARGGHAQLQAELATVAESVQTLDGELDKAEQEKGTLLQQRSLVAAEVTKLTNQVVASASSNASLEESLCVAEQEQSQLKERMAQMEEEQKVLEAELTAAKAWEEDYARLLQERSLIQKEFKSLTNKFVAVNNEKVELSEQLASVEKALLEVQESASATEQENYQLRHEVKEMKSENTQLESRVLEAESARSLNSTLIAEQVAKLTQKAVEASEENSKLRKQLAELESRMAKPGRKSLPARSDAAPDVARHGGNSESKLLAALGSILDAETPGGLLEWLRQRRLQEYLPIFEAGGYSSLASLRSASAEDISSLIASCDMPKGRVGMLQRGMVQLKAERELVRA